MEQAEIVFDHEGRKHRKKLDFFKKPKNIGEIISGESDLEEGEKEYSTGKKIKQYLINIAVAIFISFAIIIFAKIESEIWFIIWLIVPLAISIWLATAMVRYSGNCSYVGNEGFARYRFEDSKENITESEEIRFEEITDLFTAYTIVKKNFSYEKTEFAFTWLNGEDEIFSIDLMHYNQHEEKGKYDYDYQFYKAIEGQWTLHLIKEMDKTLERDWYLTFNLLSKSGSSWTNVPYLKLRRGELIFLNGKDGEEIYTSENIKRVYVKDHVIYFEDEEFEKKLFKKNKGKSNSIPIANLSNKKYFFKAFEDLMGYKF